jgi:hypothetical protein
MATNRKNNNNLNWANALDQITKKEIAARQPTGSGWQTFQDIYKTVNVGQCKLRKQLKAGLDDGSILMFNGQDLGIDGKRRQKVWYKIKQ